jgi:hypothetical protein
LGFRVAEVFAAYGGRERIESHCSGCSVNVGRAALAPANPTWGGCCGLVEWSAWGEADSWNTLIDRLLAELAPRDAWRQMFLPTQPAWPGLWAAESFSAAHWELLEPLRLSRDGPKPNCVFNFIPGAKCRDGVGWSMPIVRDAPRLGPPIRASARFVVGMPRRCPHGAAAPTVAAPTGHSTGCSVPARPQRSSRVTGTGDYTSAAVRSLGEIREARFAGKGFAGKDSPERLLDGEPVANVLRRSDSPG